KYMNPAVYTHSDFTDILQKRRTVIFYSNNNISLMLPGFCQCESGFIDIIAIGGWNGVAVWVEWRKTQKFIEPFHQFVGFDMFQLLGHIMHFIPAESQLVK